MMFVDEPAAPPEPVIFTPEDPDYPAYDTSQVDEIPSEVEVVKCPIWEPYTLYRKFTGRDKKEKIYSGFLEKGKSGGWAQKASVFIRGNLFIPDARKFWIRPAIKYMQKYLKANPVDIIISTGPPHTTHMIGLGVKKRTGLPWIADFRDPWTNIDFYDKLALTDWADRKHRRMEQLVLKNADSIVTVSPSWVDDFKALSGREVELITNGFDPKDFENTSGDNGGAVLTHIGSINPDRNPANLWMALENVLEMGGILPDEFKLRLIGPIDQGVTNEIAQLPRLNERFEHIPWKDHGEVIQDMQNAGVLLLLVNKAPNALGILPGKLFEYIGSGRPILSVGPQGGDVQQIIKDSGAGICADLNSVDQIVDALRELYSESKVRLTEPAYIRRFSREQLAKDYSVLMKKVVEKAN